MADRVHPTAFGQIAIAERALAVLAADGLPAVVAPAALISYRDDAGRAPARRPDLRLPRAQAAGPGGGHAPAAAAIPGRLEPGGQGRRPERRRAPQRVGEDPHGAKQRVELAGQYEVNGVLPPNHAQL